GTLLSLSNSFTFNNNSGGLFDLQGDGAVFDIRFGNGPFMNNAGATLRKSGGTGVSSFNVALTNAGVVDVESGSFDLAGDGSSTGNINVASSATFLFDSDFTLNSGTTLTGSGTFQLNGGVTLTINGTINSPQKFILAGGTLSIAGSNTFTIPNGITFTFNSGTVTGTGFNIASGGTLNLFVDDTDNFSDATLN